MIRFIILYLAYLRRKLLDKKVSFRGFSIIFSFKESSIQIGKGTVINSSPLSNLIGLYQRTIIIARHRGKIVIGEKCGISGVTIYSMSSITIGNYCNIGANCKIIDNDFHPIDKLKRRDIDTDSIRKKPIKIGDDCFIGMNSIILKGTILGDNVIVGAGSVVSGIFPPNTIIAGNPAKIIAHSGLNKV